MNKTPIVIERTSDPNVIWIKIATKWFMVAIKGENKMYVNGQLCYN